jgi:hypothetical protein
MVIVEPSSYERIIQTEGIELDLDLEATWGASLDMDVAHDACPALELSMSDNQDSNPLPRNSQLRVVLLHWLGLQEVWTEIKDPGSLGVVKGHVG